MQTYKEWQDHANTKRDDWNPSADISTYGLSAMSSTYPHSVHRARRQSFQTEGSSGVVLGINFITPLPHFGHVLFGLTISSPLSCS